MSRPVLNGEQLCYEPKTQVDNIWYQDWTLWFVGSKKVETKSKPNNSMRQRTSTDTSTQAIRCGWGEMVLSTNSCQFWRQRGSAKRMSSFPSVLANTQIHVFFVLRTIFHPMDYLKGTGLNLWTVPFSSTCQYLKTCFSCATCTYVLVFSTCT